MATASNGQKQVVLARKIDAGYDVRGIDTLSDHARALVDHPVPDFAGLVVFGIPGLNKVSPQVGLQLFHEFVFWHVTSSSSKFADPGSK